MADSELTFSVRTCNGHTVVRDWRLKETIISILEQRQVTCLNDISIELVRAEIKQEPVTPPLVIWNRLAGEEVDRG